MIYLLAIIKSSGKCSLTLADEIGGRKMHLINLPEIKNLSTPEIIFLLKIYGRV